MACQQFGKFIFPQVPSSISGYGVAGPRLSATTLISYFKTGHGQNLTNLSALRLFCIYMPIFTLNGSQLWPQPVRKTALNIPYPLCQACEVNIKQKKKSKERKNYLQSIKSKPKLVIVVVFLVWEGGGTAGFGGSPGGAAVLIFSSKTGDGGEKWHGKSGSIWTKARVFFF